MDKVQNKFIAIFISILSIFFMAFFVCNLIPKSDSFANADTSYIAFDEITCTKFNFDNWENVDDCQATNTETVYYKNLKVKFDINNTLGTIHHYNFSVQKNEGDILTGDWVIIENQLEIIPVFYEIIEDGDFTISLNVYNSTNNIIDTQTQMVKSDLTIPNILGDVNEMTEYLKEGRQFDIEINTHSASDETSGIDRIYYAFDYYNENLTDINHTQIEADYASIGITDNGVLSIWYFDKAGNVEEQNFVFDKFDFVKPDSPQITAEPISDIVYANGYTKGYRITIDYKEDNEGGSGLATKQNYMINDINVEYTDYFLLVEPKNYVIKAKSVDKAGNFSDETVAEISSTNYDTIVPSVNNIKLYVDMTKTLPASIQFIGADQFSGIDYAYIEGLENQVNFTKKVSDVYAADFDCFGLSGVVVHVVDKVGNDSINHIAINYFGSSMAETLQTYHQKYSEIIWNSYNENSQNEINNKYTLLNNYLMTINTQSSDFNKLFSEIDKLLLGINNYEYIIKNSPTYISSSINYEIVEGDIANYLKGDNIKLEFKANFVENQKDFVKLAEIKEGFAEGFSLKAYHNDKELNNLSNGIKIEMGMP